MKHCSAQLCPGGGGGGGASSYYKFPLDYIMIIIIVGAHNIMFSIHIRGMDGRGWGSKAGLGAMVVAGLISRVCV